MRSIENYHTGQNLKQVVDTLCDPKLSFETHREQMNDVVMTAVIEYTREYMGVTGSVAALKEKIELELEVIKEGREIAILHGVSHTQLDKNGHFLALQCLVDVRPTAAIFKEIENAGEYLAARQRYTRRDEICAVTGRRLRAEDGIYLVIPDRHKDSFPNRAASKKLVDMVGFVDATARIQQRFQEAFAYRDWFNHFEEEQVIERI